MYSSVNTIWVLLGAALVFFMQAGFAMCETGFTRAKNSGNILMKNLMDFSIGTPVFWLVGFGLMFGAGNGIIGTLDPRRLFFYSAGWCSAFCIPDFPDGILCDRGNHCLRFDGRAYQVLRILPVLSVHLPVHLPDFRSLDLGRRLAR